MGLCVATGQCHSALREAHTMSKSNFAGPKLPHTYFGTSPDWLKDLDWAHDDDDSFSSFHHINHNHPHSHSINSHSINSHSIDIFFDKLDHQGQGCSPTTGAFISLSSAPDNPTLNNVSPQIFCQCNAPELWVLPRTRRHRSHQPLTSKITSSPSSHRHPQFSPSLESHV